jgi:hypothetical protein
VKGLGLTCAATYLKGKVFPSRQRHERGKTDETAKANDGGGEDGRDPVRGS